MNVFRNLSITRDSVPNIPDHPVRGVYAIFAKDPNCLPGIVLPSSGLVYIGLSTDLGQRNHFNAPYQIQGKIERWHQTLKNRILLENYYLPGDLKAQLDAFVEHYNHRRYHERSNNLTPADVYFGSGQFFLVKRKKIKRKTVKHQRLQHHNLAA